MGFFDNNIGDGINNDISSIATDVLGIKKASTTKVASSTLPWMPSQDTPSTSSFMPPINIDPLRWNQLFPYRLLVIDSSQGNSAVGGDPNQKVSLQSVGDDYIINFTPILNSWSITLPVTPQQLSIVDQYAINTTATLRGVVEEHNGVKFKMISAAGTTGVWLNRESVTKSPTSPGLIKSLFGNTLSAASSLISGVTGVVNALLNGSTASKPVTVNPENSQAGKYSTGYFQMMALQQFLEQYAEAKKIPDNAGWRLVLDIPKQNQSFVVSPIQFNWQQNANKPLEIDYTMQFKAWRRIDLNNKAKPVALTVNQVSPGLLQTLLNTLAAARQVMALSLNLISAVQSDATAPLNVLRQTTLLLKDGAGVIATAADLPASIANAYSPSINSYIVANSTAITSQNPDPLTSQAVAAVVADSVRNEGLTTDAVLNGQLGVAAANLQAASPANQIYQTPAAYYNLLDAVPVNSLTLTTEQQNELNQLYDQIREITVDDLKQYRATILTLANNISNYYGTSTQFYSNLYGTSTPIVRTQPIDIDQYQVLNSLYGVMDALDTLTATTYYDDINRQTNMEYVAGLANASNIEFSIPNSMIVAPVPFGLTVEGIAARYLNDAQRWLEIVTLNNLREPYIDETGFQYPLLSNGTGRQITIADSTNLYIGQTITLYSSITLPTSRKILGIEILPSTTVLITLDGEANLDTYTTTGMAYLKAYLPGTTNSQQQIFIPSNLTAQTPDSISLPPAVAGQSLVGLSKVDLLMTSSGDLATNNYGDFRLSAGLTNLIQALNIKMGTVKGTVLTHPDYGLGIRAGMSTADFTAQSLYDTINKLITDDPRFGGIETLQIAVNKASLTINLVVFLAQGNGVLPITYELNI